MENFEAQSQPSLSKMDEKTPVESLSFREAMSELESIVQALEGNELELEESLVRYERGVSLLSSLQGRLSNAQQKIDVLIGELEQEPSDAVRDTNLS